LLAAAWIELLVLFGLAVVFVAALVFRYGGNSSDPGRAVPSLLPPKVKKERKTNHDDSQLLFNHDDAPGLIFLIHALLLCCRVFLNIAA